MIVVDTNVIAALILPAGSLTEQATDALELDRDWVAPLLWRSEFRNILATALRGERVSLEQALEAMETAERVMEGGEFGVFSAEVLKSAAETGCTAYDTEFAVLAQDLSVKLVTLDRDLLGAFPDSAVSLKDFVG